MVAPAPTLAPVPSSVETLSIVMPAYNEADNLPVVVPQVIEACRRIGGQRTWFELVLINDGSTDATATVITDLAARYSEIRPLAHERNRGLTAALRTGYYAAENELVLFIPADGQIPVEAIPVFLAAAQGHDVVLSHYRHRPDGIQRAVLSLGLRLLLRLALGFGDRSDGTYLFRRSLLDSIPLVAERSAGSIGFEIAAKARAAGRPIASVVTDCAPRLSGTSKVANLRSIREYLGEIFRIRRSMR